MKKITFIVSYVIALFCFVIFFTEVSADEFRYAQDSDGELIIVLDPGHGGENLGADYEGKIEKEINMILANSMYEHLSKYDGITVYMTRTEDVDLSLLERAQFAKSVNADYLFCLHFNMSEFHTLYGTEIWIQSTGVENREGYQFGCIWLEDMKNHGLYLRGIKTRLNSKGKDYYGILRHCKEFDITAVLLEHAHLDHLADSGFADSREDLINLGVLDAESVAKYFGLSSTILGVDYSNYPLKEIEPNADYMVVDNTEPDMSYIQLEECNYETGEVTVSVMAYDIDTPMLYYQYSVDGGDTFSPLIAWPGVDMLEEISPDSFLFSMTIEEETTPQIVVRVHNKYNVTKDSNVLMDFKQFPSRTPIIEPSIEEPLMEEVDATIIESTDKADIFMYSITIFAAVLVLFIVLLLVRRIFTRNR